jgi:hypothetical protein
MSINHRAEALRLAEESHGVLRPNDEGHCEADRLLAEAQVHATLARDEEQAARTADMRDIITLLRRREDTVRELVSVHIAKALASRDADRWKAGVDLAKALDDAGASMDHHIDNWLSDDGWDPRSAWKAPAAFAPAGGWMAASAGRSSAAPADDPWAATPQPYIPGKPYSQPVETALRNLNLAGHVTPADTLAATIPVIAGHVAEALVDGENDAVRKWARSVIDELRRVGLDLAGHVERRAEDLRPETPFSYDTPPGYSDEPPF